MLTLQLTFNILMTLFDLENKEENSWLFSRISAVPCRSCQNFVYEINPTTLCMRIIILLDSNKTTRDRQFLY